MKVHFKNYIKIQNIQIRQNFTPLYNIVLNSLFFSLYSIAQLFKLKRSVRLRKILLQCAHVFLRFLMRIIF